MLNIISKEFMLSKNNVFVWLNAAFLIVLLLIDKTEPLTVVMAYFLETIVIGVIHAFKLYNIISYKKQDNYLVILKFLSQYLFFVAVQLIFVFAFLKFYNSNIIEAYYLIDNIKYVLSLKGMWLVLASIVIYNIADYIINFLAPKIYDTVVLKQFLSQPYKRILVQQFTVILACFFYFFISGVLIAAVALILLRTYIELYFQANQD